MFRTAHHIVPLALVAALVLTVPAAHSADSAAAARERIAPWVLEHASATTAAECIVVLADQADLAPAAQLRSRADKARFVREALLDKARTTQAPLLAWLDERHVGYRSFYIVNAVLVDATLDVAEAIAARADVARVDGNPSLPQIQPVQLSPEEARAAVAAPQSVDAVEPGVTATRAPEVWASGVTGQGIVVGGADTGVRWDHPALKGHYRGWNGTVASHDYNWHDAVHSGGGTCGANATAPCDDYGHGTHTIATAVGGDSSGTNQVGVAPGAQFIACRNMDVGNGTPARYLECMEWFLAPYPVGGTPAQGDPLMAPDVTNNSWGCPASEGCTWSTLQAGIEAQRAAGILFVASAGNSGSSCSTVSEPPAIYDAAYSVGAYSATTGNLASFSSRGPVTVDGSGRMKPDIVAPGVSVRSALSNGSYGTMSGTSMAGPHVAGAVALLWAASATLRNDIARTEDILNHAAVPVVSAQCDAGAVPNNAYGWGRLDIRAATLSLVGVGPDTPAAGGVALAPASPNPAHRSTLLRFRLARAGGVELALFASDGRRVRTLARGAFAAGEHTLRWDGFDDRGEGVPPAVYHARLVSGGASASQKLIWLGR